jgi:hypothetical protein
MIVSCGDSFFYGSDLQDTLNTWPSLIAKRLGHEYHCQARPGVGNLQILKQILEAQQQFGNSAVYLINWTWIDRFDYINTQDEQWHTVRPSLDDATRDPAYYRLFHSEQADKFTNLVYISQAIQALQGHRYLMTYMDPLMFDQQWHAPDYIKTLQDKVRTHLNSFDGQTFLEWSRSNGYPESKHWHPLETAHQAAADHWSEKVQSL